MGESDPGAIRRPCYALDARPWDDLAPVAAVSAECQKRRVGVPLERHEVGMSVAEKGLDRLGGAVAAPDPDHFGRLSAHEAELVEVGILRDNREPMPRGVLPDGFVVGPFEAQLPDVHGVRIKVGKDQDQANGEILIEEQAHVAAPALRLRQPDEPALPVGGEGEARANVLARQVRKVCEDLVLGHPGREVLEHVIHRDAQPADTGFPAPLAGLDGDDALVVHAPTLGQAAAKVKAPQGGGVLGDAPASQPHPARTERASAARSA